MLSRYVSGGVVSLAAMASAAFAQSDGFQINCKIDSIREVAISAPVPGVVAEVQATRGGNVAKGDVLVRLDDDLARSEAQLTRQQASYDGFVRAAEVRLASLESRRDRLKSAGADKAIRQADFDALLLEVDLARIELERQRQDQILLGLRAEQAEILADKLTIYSPVDGVVGEDLIAVGESTAANPVATIFMSGSLRIEAFVPVQLLDEVISSDALMFVDPDRNVRLPVELDYVAPVANLSSGTISVYLNLDGSDVRPGSKCRLDF